MYLSTRHSDMGMCIADTMAITMFVIANTWITVMKLM